MSNKKTKEKNTTVTGIICLILFIFMTVILLFVEGDILLDKSQNFYELEASEGVQKDKYVSIPVDAVFANYAETKHTVNFIPTGKDQHYILWLEDNKVISLTIKNKKAIKELDKICDQTWDYIEGKTESVSNGITLKGKIHTMDPEIEGYYEKMLGMIGVTSADFEIYYVTIDCTTTPFTVAMYLLFAFVMIAISIGMIVGDQKQKKNLAIARARAEEANNMVGVVESDDTTFSASSNYEGIDKNLLK